MPAATLTVADNLPERPALVNLDRTPSEISRQAAEEIRALNHRTLNQKAFDQPPAVSDVASNVATLLAYLPQAIDQMEAGITALYEQNGIRLADRPEGTVSQKDIADQVSAVLSGLRDAREDVQRAHESIQRATGPLTHMGGPWPDDEDDE